MPRQWTALLNKSYPTSSPTKLLFIADAKAGGTAGAVTGLLLQRCPTQTESGGRSLRFLVQMLCAMTALQGAAALKEHYTEPGCRHHVDRVSPKHWSGSATRKTCNHGWQTNHCTTCSDVISNSNINSNRFNCYGNSGEDKLGMTWCHLLSKTNV